jgi:hypothetical protein
MPVTTRSQSNINMSCLSLPFIKSTAFSRSINQYCEDNYDKNELFGDFKSSNPRKLHGKNVKEIAELYPKTNPEKPKQRLYGRGWHWKRAGYNSFYFKFFGEIPYIPTYCERFSRIDVEYIDARDEKGNLVMLPSIENGLSEPGYRWKLSLECDNIKFYDQELI